MSKVLHLPRNLDIAVNPLQSPAPAAKSRLWTLDHQKTRFPLRLYRKNPQCGHTVWGKHLNHLKENLEQNITNRASCWVIAAACSFEFSGSGSFFWSMQDQRPSGVPSKAALYTPRCLAKTQVKMKCLQAFFRSCPWAMEELPNLTCHY